jgi:hypothetical protein
MRSPATKLTAPRQWACGACAGLYWGVPVHFDDYDRPVCEGCAEACQVCGWVGCDGKHGKAVAR